MRVSFVVCGVMLMGCGQSMMVPGPDAGEVPDAGTRFDAGDLTDAGVPADAGERVDAGTTADAGLPSDAGAPLDAGLPTDAGLDPCPTTGMGAITPPAACFTLTPMQSGLPRGGDAHYALEPGGTAKGALVLYLPSSIAVPEMQVPDPVRNFYNAAAQRGFHVIALAHENQQVLGISCRNNAACYGASRETVLTGVYQTGAAVGLRSITPQDGIVARLEAALRTLAARRPGQGWSQFLTPQGVDWSRVIATGHSQGGGHAAYLGQRFAVRRVVQLSSTCDLDQNDMPAPWTSASLTWATSPATSFVGFAAPSNDSICPGHVAVWMNMGMDASRMFRDAATCGAAQTHNVTINCLDNFPRWGPLLE